MTQTKARSIPEWTMPHRRLVLDGLREMRSYEQIAESLENIRPGVTADDIHKLIRYKYKGMKRFLESYLGGTREARAEIERIAAHYLRGHPTAAADKGAVIAVPQPKPAPEPKPLIEPKTLDEILIEGFKGNKTLGQISDEATLHGDRSYTANDISNMIRRYRGIDGLLEHHGLSAAEARKIASAYTH